MFAPSTPDALESATSFRIQIAGERFRVPARARFSVEHERGDGEEEVEFQLTWTLDDAGTDAGTDAATDAAGDPADGTVVQPRPVDLRTRSGGSPQGRPGGWPHPILQASVVGRTISTLKTSR